MPHISNYIDCTPIKGYRQVRVGRRDGVTFARLHRYISFNDVVWC